MLKEDYNKKFDKRAAKAAPVEVQNEEIVVTDEIREVTSEVEEEPVKVEEAPKAKKVKVAIPDLNIRKGPGKNFDRIGQFTGVGVFEVSETENGFAKLADGRGWVSMEFAKLI